jgi:recombination protein RecT
MTNQPQQHRPNVPAPQNQGGSSYNLDSQQLAALEANFKANMGKYQKSIASLLQGKYGIGKDEFLVSAFQAIKKTPKLLMCNVESLFGAILLSAEMKLKFNTPENHAYIIPYGTEANFQIGYQGLIELMYRSPRVRRIIAEPVFSKDEFRYSLGLVPDLHHVPYLGADGRGDLIATYCVVQLKDAEPVFTVVAKSELDAVKNLSKAKDKKDSPYNSGTDVHHWMEIKVAIKKVAKLIPKGEDEAFISKAIEADSKMETGARIVAPIPKSENDLVSAEDIKIIDSPKTIQTAQYGVNFSQESNATTDEGLADLVKDQKPSTPQTDVQVTQNSIEPDEKKFESGNDSQTNEQKRVGRPPKNPQLTIE